MRQSMLRRLVPAILIMASWAMAPGVPGEAGPDYLDAPRESLDWFTDARFGMFVHWGPSSFTGREISWSRKADHRGVPEFTRAWGSVPAEEYDNLYRKFNPVEYDAREWVQIARDAGMEYIVLTTKHHDGFAMFESRASTYTIESAPYPGDIVGELAEACHEAGFGLGLYYSQPDWYHPDYLTDNHDRYIDFFHTQVRELLTNYGKVDVMWFDGLGLNQDQLKSHDIFRMIRTLQPEILINNRCGLPGDFDTPEQRIGVFQNERPWESCITLGAQWSYSPNEVAKPLDECIRILVACASGDGNLLLNVGPRPDGAIVPAQVERLREIGSWMNQYGHVIKGTRGGPFVLGQYGGSTYRGDTAWLHLFKWRRPTLEIPRFGREIVSARLLTSDAHIGFMRTDEGYELTIDEADRDPIVTIVELKLDRPLPMDVNIKPTYLWKRPNLAAGSEVTSNVPPFGGNQATWGAYRVFDGDEGSRWATPVSVTTATLVADLGEPTELAGFKLVETYHRITSYRLEAEVDGEWVTLHKGGYGESTKEQNFDTVTTRRVRFRILDSVEGPTIEEIELYGPVVED